MLNNKILQPINFVVDPVLDIGCCTSATYFLNKSSYAWVAGGAAGYNGTGAPISSSPIAVIAIQKFSSLQYIKGLEGGGALDSFSYAWFWGSNTAGNIGNNTAANWNAPQSVVGGKQWSFLDNTVGLDFSSYAWAWGSSTIIGDNNAVNRSSPVSVVGNKQWIYLFNSGSHVLALDSSSYAWGWGSSTSGILGDNTLQNRSSPTSVVGGKQFTSIYGAVYGTNAASYALDSSSRLWAWGNNSSAGVLGDGTAFNYSSPQLISNGPFSKIYPLFTYQASVVIGATDKPSVAYVWGQPSLIFTSTNYSVPTQVMLPFNLKKIIAGTYHIVALDTNSKVWVWGSNANYQCANELNAVSIYGFAKPKFPEYSYSLYSPPQSFISIKSGNGNVYYLDTSSYLWGWGDNTYGQLGDNSTVNKTSPISVIGGRQFRYFFAGCTTGQIIAIDLSSYAWTWGRNLSGTIGDYNTSTDKSSPTSVVGGKKWLTIAGSSSTFVGIDSNSYVWVWGNSGSGQVGDNWALNRSSPTSVVGGKQAVCVVSAYSSAESLALLDLSSYAWSWGSGTLGDLGTNALLNASSPVSVVGNRQFIWLTGWGSPIMGYDASSYIWAFGGKNSLGIMGDNTTTSRSSPVSVVGNRQYIPRKTNFSCVAMDASSYAWCWGSNALGRLGDGTQAQKNSPTSVIGGYQFNYIELSNGFFGVTSFPNNKYLFTAPFVGQYADYTSSPTVNTLNYQYISSVAITSKPKNVLGKS